MEQYGKNTKDKLKLDGDKSVGRKDYLAASKLYGEVRDRRPHLHQAIAITIAPYTMNPVRDHWLR